MRYLMVKNWNKFQHYGDRNPPWIKLHRSLLDDYEFSRLPDANKAHLLLIWLFASQNDGSIPEDAKFLQTKLSLDKQPDLESFINQGLLIPKQDDSSVLADREHDEITAIALARSREKRREEKRREEQCFARFWISYPRKTAKAKASQAWSKIKPDEPLTETIIAAVQRHCRTDQWRRDGGAYIPHPATWLNQERWKDETEIKLIPTERQAVI